MVAAACSAVAPTAAAGLLIAKYTPGASAQAATIAITPTNDSMSIDPYPTSRAWPSFISILGVVPEEMSEWKPLTAPQAMVMKQKGKIFPAKTGPEPSTKRVWAGIWI